MAICRCDNPGCGLPLRPDQVIVILIVGDHVWRYCDVDCVVDSYERKLKGTIEDEDRPQA
jgi:hypothetical protein